MRDTAPLGIPTETILDLHEKGLSAREIAAILGCSVQNVHQRLKRLKGKEGAA